jgi:hypothetical protein
VRKKSLLFVSSFGGKVTRGNLKMVGVIYGVLEEDCCGKSNKWSKLSVVGGERQMVGG